MADVPTKTAFTERWCRKYGLKAPIPEVMAGHNCRDLNAVLAMKAGDVDALPLSLSQKSLLKAALNQFIQIDIPKITQKVTTEPATVRKNTGENDTVGARGIRAAELQARQDLRRRLRARTDDHSPSLSLAERILQQRKAMMGSEESLDSGDDISVKSEPVARQHSQVSNSNGGRAETAPTQEEPRPISMEPGREGSSAAIERSSKETKKKVKKKKKLDPEAEKLAALDADLDNMLQNILSDDGVGGEDGEASLARANEILDEDLLDQDDLEMLSEYNRKRENEDMGDDGSFGSDLDKILTI